RKKKPDTSPDGGKTKPDAEADAAGISTRPPGDSIPSIQDGAFARWFNDVSPADFERPWSNPKLQQAIKARLRHPGSLHDGFLGWRANTFERWGVTAEEIANDRTPIGDVLFVNPPGRHGGPGSTTAHNEILDIIDSSGSKDEFRRRLN